jgi:hypothetical protein
MKAGRGARRRPVDVKLVSNLRQMKPSRQTRQTSDAAQSGILDLALIED